MKHTLKPHGMIIKANYQNRVIGYIWMHNFLLLFGFAWEEDGLLMGTFDVMIMWISNKYIHQLDLPR